MRIIILKYLLKWWQGGLPKDCCLYDDINNLLKFVNKRRFMRPKTYYKLYGENNAQPDPTEAEGGD